eukprot:symbB.v1.2.025962.t1/scaffold2558.1/size76401/2
MANSVGQIPRNSPNPASSSSEFMDSVDRHTGATNSPVRVVRKVGTGTALNSWAAVKFSYSSRKDEVERLTNELTCSVERAGYNTQR